MAMMRLAGAAVLAALLCVVAVHAADPLMAASFIDAKEAKTYTVYQPKSEVTGLAPPPPQRAAPRMQVAPGVTAKQLWTENEQYAVYTTGGVSNQSPAAPSTFALGTWLNPPVEAYSLDLNGKHAWDFTASSTSAQFDIATARHIDTHPAGDVDVAVAEFSGFFDRPYSCSVFGFASAGARATGKPVWQYDIPACQASMLNSDIASIVMSDDGSTVAFAAASNRSTTGGSDFTTPSPQLYVFDGQSGKLLFVFDLRGQATVMPGGLSITRHGEWIAFSNGAFTYIVDRATGKLRGNGPPVNKGVSVPCHICPMGTFITWGNTEAHISKWNATTSTYVDRFVLPARDADGTQWYVMESVTTINGGGGDPNGCLVAFGYIDQNARRVRVEVYNMFTAKKYWQWTSPQDTAVQTEPYLSFHLGYLAVAHWGNDDATAPQTLLFGLQSNSSLFSFTSPGSMFDVQVAVQNAPIPSFLDGHADYESAIASTPKAAPRADPQNILVIAAGKHVHASQMGNGGDAYAFVVTV